MSWTCLQRHGCINSAPEESLEQRTAHQLLLLSARGHGAPKFQGLTSPHLFSGPGVSFGRFIVDSSCYSSCSGIICFFRALFKCPDGVARFAS